MLAGVVYAIVGGVRVPEVEITGLLEPGNDPTPPNGCDPRPNLPPEMRLPPDALKVLIGDNGIAHSGMGRFTALRIGQCDVLGMERTSAGIGVYADLFDADGRHIAAVTNNALHVLTGETISMSRRGDLSTLVVTKAGWPWWISWLLGNGDAELLYVHYLNPTTVQARGIFGCSMHKLITVTDGQPVPGIFMHHGCLAARIGISVQ